MTRVVHYLPLTEIVDGQIQKKTKQLFSSVVNKSRYGRRRLVTEVDCLRNFSEELSSLAADNVTGSYISLLMLGYFQNNENYCRCSRQQWTSGQNMSNNKDLIDKLSLFFLFNKRTGMHSILWKPKEQYIQKINTWNKLHIECILGLTYSPKIGSLYIYERLLPLRGSSSKLRVRRGATFEGRIQF